MTLTFGSGNGTSEIIGNGSFENGDSPWEVGWTGTIGTVSSDDAHAGTYSYKLITDYIEDFILQSVRQNFSAVAYNDVVSFGFWVKSSPWQSVGLTLYFADSSSKNITIYLDGSGDWQYVNIMSIVWNGCTGEMYFNAGQSCTGIEFDSAYVSTIFIDEVSLIAGQYFTEAISWEEQQSCDVAMRPIPLKDNGAHIDTGTYVLNPRILNVTIRMNDIQRTEFLAYFALNTLMTFYANDGIGIWTYVGWFKDFPRIYEYSRKSSGDIRKWKCDLRFTIQSISYSGSAYSESTDTIVINGENYNPVLDFAIGISNSLGDESQYVNNSTVSLETEVWSKSATKLNYVIRTTSAGKYLLDQLIAAHAITNLIDAEYGYSNYTWLQYVNETWEGDINNAKPWKIELTLILLIDLGAY